MPSSIIDMRTEGLEIVKNSLGSSKMATENDVDILHVCYPRLL